VLHEAASVQVSVPARFVTEHRACPREHIRAAVRFFLLVPAFHRIWSLVKSLCAPEGGRSSLESLLRRCVVRTYRDKCGACLRERERERERKREREREKEPWLSSFYARALGLCRRVRRGPRVHTRVYTCTNPIILMAAKVLCRFECGTKWWSPGLPAAARCLIGLIGHRCSPVRPIPIPSAFHDNEVAITFTRVLRVEFVVRLASIARPLV
jgi:hypothetical protein